MESIKELRKICQSPRDLHNPDSFLGQRFWRFFSIYITKLLLYTPIKPDHITFFMIFWGFLAGFFFSIGTYKYMIIGTIVLEFFMVLDALDGEVARYKKLFSVRGGFLDIIAHMTNTIGPFIGMTIGLYKYNPSVYIVLAGLSASAFSLFCFNIQAISHHVLFKEFLKRLAEKKLTKTTTGKIAQTNIKPGILKSIGKLINYLYDHTYMVQIILITAILGQLYWLLIFYGITFPLFWLAKLIYEYREGYKPYEGILMQYKK